MSQYSEMMGSFIRTGNYPLEANYIFPTEAALKEFYSDPINATTLHKGLFRIVENGGDGRLALYWVVKKLTNDELEFIKLIETTDISNIDSQLLELKASLLEEVLNRTNVDNAIWGTTDPSNIPEDLNSLLDIVSAISDLTRDLDSIHSELTDTDGSIKSEVKAIAGTLSNDVTAYLKTLPYLSLTEVSRELNKFLTEVDNSSTLILTFPELQSFLEGYTDSQKLKDVLAKIPISILGDPNPSEEFRTLRAIEDFVRILKSTSENSDQNLQSELDQTQVGIGLSGDGSYNADKETHYLGDATSVMNALKILDSILYQSLFEVSFDTDNKDVVQLDVRRELESYVISAKLDLSPSFGNALIKKDDGLFVKVDSEYLNGTLTLKVNDAIVALHHLGFSAIVQDAYYESSTESIVIIFKLLDGNTLTVRLPVGALIREWNPDNSHLDRVIEIYRELVINGSDKVSADVRIALNTDNILEKEGNTLIVRGTSDNIKHHGNSLDTVIDNKADLIDGKVPYSLLPYSLVRWIDIK